MKAKKGKSWGTCKDCGFEASTSTDFSIHTSECPEPGRYHMPTPSVEWLAWRDEYQSK